MIYVTPQNSKQVLNRFNLFDNKLVNIIGTYLSNKLMWTKNVFGYSKNYYNETLHSYNLKPISAALPNHRYSSRDPYQGRGVFYSGWRQ